MKAFFWNLIAKSYSKQTIANEEAYQRKLTQTSSYLSPESEVFEFGCGTGSTSIFHAANVKHILATDISEKMIEIAKDKAQTQQITNVDFRCAAIEELELQDQSFDVVLAMSILHLLEDKDSVIKKIHRATKKGGVLITSTICISESFPAFRWITPITNLFGFLPLIKCFNTSELEQSIIEAGFTIEDKWSPGPKEATFIIARKENGSPKRGQVI